MPIIKNHIRNKVKSCGVKTYINGIVISGKSKIESRLNILKFLRQTECLG